MSVTFTDNWDGNQLNIYLRNDMVYFDTVAYPGTDDELLISLNLTEPQIRDLVVVLTYWLEHVYVKPE